MLRRYRMWFLSGKDALKALYSYKQRNLETGKVRTYLAVLAVTLSQNVQSTHGKLGGVTHAYGDGCGACEQLQLSLREIIRVLNALWLAALPSGQ